MKQEEVIYIKTKAVNHHETKVGNQHTIQEENLATLRNLREFWSDNFSITCDL